MHSSRVILLKKGLKMKKKGLSIIVVGVELLSLLGGTLLASIPHIMNYQGKLTDPSGGPVSDGNYQIIFRIYDVATGGTPLWEEIDTVSVQKGLFNIVLGSKILINLSFNKDYWLGIQVENDQEMTPRHKLTSVGYGFKTENSDMVDSIHASTTPIPNCLYPLDASAKIPNDLLYAGSGGGLDADMVDGKDASAFTDTTNDYGRFGVTNDLYEGSTKLADKYLGKTATAVNSDKVDGYDAGNASENVPISNGILNNNLNADMLDGLHASSFLNSSSDYGRSGVATDLYEGTTELTDKYLGKTETAVNSDKVDNIHASATPTANYLYPLDTNAKFPNSRLYTGSGNGLDADMVDGHHASDFLSTSSDYGRSGVAVDLYEGTTKLSDKYLGKTVTAVNSDKVDGYDAGNALGNVPISNGTLNNNLNADMLDGLHASSFLNTSSDYGRYGVSGTLYEGTSSLSNKYVNEGQSNSISNPMIQSNAVTSTKIQDETITGTDIQKPLGLSGSSTAQILHVENNSSSGYGIASIIHHSANTNKAAFYGESVASEGGGIGAWGVTHSPGTSSGCALGLYGVSSSPTSIGGAALGVLGRSYSVPVSGSDASSGVFGWGDVSSGRTYGVWGETRSSTNLVSGVYGVNIATSGMTRGTIGTVNSTTAGAAGVLGAAPSTGAVRGVMGYCHSSSGYAMYSDGNFGIAPGYTKAAIVRTSQGAVKLYCQESPGVWFEDFGEGQLSNGRIHIELDGLFLETVTINERHPMKVFIQLNDDCTGVYVKRGATGFDVIELQNGKSNAPFTYRVVAKRRGFENTRLEKCDDALIDSDIYHVVKGKVLPR